jgi:hypothetical protein
MATYKLVPGRRAGDGWLIVLDVPGQDLNVIRSFETLAEAKAEASRLAAASEFAPAWELTQSQPLPSPRPTPPDQERTIERRRA